MFILSIQKTFMKCFINTDSAEMFNYNQSQFKIYVVILK